MGIHLVIRPRIRGTVLCLGILFGATVLLLRPEATAGGISRGLSICASVIVPSLFPFLVLSGFVVRSGVAAAIGNRLNSLTRLLFGLPGCCAAGILVGFIGGYPAGAAAIGELVRSERITREEGKRMLGFCVCGGPGFVISTVGAGLMNSLPFGIVLYLAHLLAALAIGIGSAPRAARQRTQARPSAVPRRSIPTAFVDSVTEACQSLLTMCGFILLFCALLSILDSFALGEHRLLSVLVACVTEVSCGCVSASGLWLIAPFLLSFSIGFGGLSVHCQLAAMLHGAAVMTPRFWIARLVHGILTTLFTVLLLRFLPLSIPVALSGSSVAVKTFSGGVGLSVFLLILCGIWLLVVDKRGQVFYNENNI